MPEDLKAILERVISGSSTEEDIQVLIAAIKSGQVTFATGERAVALGGDASDTVIVTGANNVIITLKGADAKAIQKLFQKTNLSTKTILPKRLIVIIGIIGMATLSAVGFIFSEKKQQISTQQSPACSLPASQVKTNWRIYQAPTEPIQIQYPPDWHLQHDEDAIRKTIIRLTPPQTIQQYQAFLSVSFDNVSEQPKTWEEYKTLVLKQIINFGQDATIQDICKVMLPNGEPYAIIYTLKEQGYVVRKLEVGVYTYQKVYYLTYAAPIEDFPQFLGTMKEVMSSFKFTADN